MVEIVLKEPLGPKDRLEIPKPYMMFGVQEAWDPVQFDAAARRCGFQRDNDRRRHGMLIAAWDNLISGNFLTRSDVYFSAPSSSRNSVEDALKRLERGRSPGWNSGVHRGLRELCAIPEIDIEVCYRYGPLESLYGDAFASLRRYELLAWALLQGVAETAFPGDSDDWRRMPWWEKGVPKDERKRLAADWVTRSDLLVPWHAATFEVMVAMAKHLGQHLGRRLKGLPFSRLADDLDALRKVRNALVHPLSSKPLRQDDFELISTSLLSLVTWADLSVREGFTAADSLPDHHDLLLPENLRVRLYGSSSRKVGSHDVPVPRVVNERASSEAEARYFAAWRGAAGARPSPPDAP